MSTIEASTYVPTTATGGGGRPRRILLGMMVAVFFSGGVIGSGSTLMVINRRIKENEQPHKIDYWNQRIVAELEEKLSLSEKQTAQVDQIMKDHLAALDRLRRETFSPLIREQFKQMEDQVNSVLDEEQRSQWHAWLDERRKRVCPNNKSAPSSQKPAPEKQKQATGNSRAAPENSGAWWENAGSRCGGAT